MPLNTKASPDPDPSLRDPTGRATLLCLVSNILPTMDLSNAIAAEEADSTETTTTTSTADSEIPFEANESTEGYALFANSASLVGAISTEIFGNDPVYSLLEWGMDLEDYQEIVEENDLNGQQKLDLLHKLAKSTFGERQSQLNEGYGMGWDTDESPPKVYDNDNVEHVPYLDVFADLPAFDHETLDGGEIDGLENPEVEGATALDMDDFGFDRSVTGPQLPVIDGERVPIVFENGDEVTKMLRMLNSIDFDEVTYCEEGGTLQGTPTLGPSEGASEDSSEGTESDDEEIDLASNPERVKEVTVESLKNGANRVSDISSLRTIQTMLRVEQENDPRSSAVERLQQRRNALQGSDEEADDEESEADSSVPSLSELSDVDKQLVSALLSSGEADDQTDAIRQVVGE